MISIIVPFNNGKKYLNNCLKNLSKNNYKDFEVILIDDFSEDNSEDIAKKYVGNLKINYYYTNERTIGVGNARNLGITKATGDYIMFLDVDDEIDYNLLNYAQQFIEKDIEMIKFKMKIIKNNKETNGSGPVFDLTNGQDGFNKLCFRDKFLDSPCLYLIKKELFKRTNLKFEKNVYHEDFGLIPSLIVNAKTIVSTNYYGYHYFQTDESIMRNGDYDKKIKKVNDKFYLYDKLLQNLKRYSLTKETKENMLEYYTNSMILAIKDLKFQNRRRFGRIIKKRGLIENIKPRNVKQFVKKIILNGSIELYFIVQKRKINCYQNVTKK